MSRAIASCSVKFSGVVTLLLLTIMYHSSAASGQEILRRAPTESISQFASRTINAKNVSASDKPAEIIPVHHVTEGVFGPSGKHIIFFYGSEKSASGGTVLVQEKGSTDIYRKYDLPYLEEIGLWQVVSGTYVVKAAFFENVDKDPEAELLVIFYREGIGAYDAEKGGRKRYSEYVTGVYDWKAEEFVVMESLGDKLYGLTSAKAVRRKLKALGYSRI